MSKYGVMVDASEEIYQKVIAPAKAEKRFNKLMSNLLSAYYHNPSVRAAIDGEEMKQKFKGLSSLQEQLKSAEESVNFMNLVGSSIEDSLNSAKEEFTSVLEDEKPISTPKSDELAEFKKEVLDSQNAFFKEMKEMFSMAMQGGILKAEEHNVVAQVVSEESRTEELKVEEPKVEGPTVTLDAGLDFSELSFDFGGTVEEAEKEIDGNVLLSRLVGRNNSASFGG